MLSNTNYKLFVLTISFFFFIVLITTLIYPNHIGMADNGDFIRTMDNVGISHISLDRNHSMFNFFIINYNSDGLYPIPSTISQLFVLFSLFINNLFEVDNNYNILYLSIIYISIYSAIFYFLSSIIVSFIDIKLPVRIFIIIGSFILLTDGLFIFYFNSFYQESASIIFIFLFSTLLLKKDTQFSTLFIVLLLIIISKSQNIIFFIFIPLLFYLYKKELQLIKIIFSIILLIFSIYYTLNMSKPYKEPNIYNSLFYGLLKNSNIDTSLDILNSLDLNDKEYQLHINKAFWPDGVRLNRKNIELSKKLYQNVTHVKIIKLYILHPKLLLNNIIFGLNKLSSTKAKSNLIGNLTKESSISKVNVETLLGSNINYFIIIIYILSVFISICILLTKKDIEAEERLILLFTFIIPFVFGLNMVGDGFFDYIKHSLSLYLIIVLLFIGNIIYILRRYT